MFGTGPITLAARIKSSICHSNYKEGAGANPPKQGYSLQIEHIESLRGKDFRFDQLRRTALAELIIKRTLIVDDDLLVSKSTMRILKLILKDAEVEIITCDQNEVDEHLKTQFDLLITDYEMPGMNGDEVIRKYKESGQGGLIIGHSGDSDNLDFFYKAGADLAGVKPLSVSFWKKIFGSRD
ncbi:response regulator [Candidatus Margulisiibacteriota bacterium]